jgi:hypothetical protein
MIVYCFFDGNNYFCAPGKGCKSPEEIAAKAEALRRRRSEGQKNRYLRRHALGKGGSND